MTTENGNGMKTGSGETVGSPGAAINPANNLAAIAAAGTPTVQRRRVPLSVPRRKLEVAPLPGYVLYWFLERDIQEAIDGGYVFVDRSEIKLNQHGVANDTDDSGNAALGSRVEVLGNKANEQGKPEQLVLMKIRQEWWDEDHALLDNRNAQIVNTIFSGQTVPGVQPQDRNTVYIDKDRTSFNPGIRPAAQRGFSQHQQGGVLNRGLPKQV